MDGQMLVHLADGQMDGFMHDWINQRSKVTKETLNLVKI